MGCVSSYTANDGNPAHPETSPNCWKRKAARACQGVEPHLQSRPHCSARRGIGNTAAAKHPAEVETGPPLLLNIMASELSPTPTKTPASKRRFSVSPDSNLSCSESTQKKQQFQTPGSSPRATASAQQVRDVVNCALAARLGDIIVMGHVDDDSTPNRKIPEEEIPAGQPHPDPMPKPLATGSTTSTTTSTPENNETKSKHYKPKSKAKAKAKSSAASKTKTGRKRQREPVLDSRQTTLSFKVIVQASGAASASMQLTGAPQTQD